MRGSARFLASHSFRKDLHALTFSVAPFVAHASPVSGVADAFCFVVALFFFFSLPGRARDTQVSAAHARRGDGRREPARRGREAREGREPLGRDAWTPPGPPPEHPRLHLQEPPGPPLNGVGVGCCRNPAPRASGVSLGVCCLARLSWSCAALSRVWVLFRCW
eukprot:2520830-Rhodomonas_salina.4